MFVMGHGLVRISCTIIYFALQATVDAALDSAALVLKTGGVVALPTDTIYGIAVCVNSDEGIKRLYSIKGRPENKPIAICVSDVHEISK